MPKKVKIGLPNLNTEVPNKFGWKIQAAKISATIILSSLSFCLLYDR